MVGIQMLVRTGFETTVEQRETTQYTTNTASVVSSTVATSVNSASSSPGVAASAMPEQTSSQHGRHFAHVTGIVYRHHRQRLDAVATVPALEQTPDLTRAAAHEPASGMADLLISRFRLSPWSAQLSLSLQRDAHASRSLAMLQIQIRT